MYSKPNCSCEKLRKCTMINSSDDLPFTSENTLPTNNIESQVKNVQNAKQKQSRTDFFNEVTGGFQGGSVGSDDTFQIVFNDAPRRRLSSDCDSEDSFIVFDDSPDSCYTSNDVFGHSDDESEDSESDANDSGFNKNSSLSKKVCNLTDDTLYEDHSEDEVDCANIEDLRICDSITTIDDRGHSVGFRTSQEKNSPAKRVRFSPNPPKVHVMRVWLYAAKQARCRYWQQFAVDRERFQRRIADVESAVSWVLRPQHRSRVSFQRYVQKRMAEKKEREERKKLEEERRLKTVEFETQYPKLNEENHEADNNLDENDTNTKNPKPKEVGVENFDDNYSDLTPNNTLNNEKTGNENENLADNEFDYQNRTNVNSVENEDIPKKDLNEKLCDNEEMLPFSDKTLDIDCVSTPEYVDLNS